MAWRVTADLRTCFVLCVLLTVAALLAVLKFSLKPMTPLLVTFPLPAPERRDPIQTAVTLEKCPCFRDLQKVMVKGAPMEMETNEEMLMRFLKTVPNLKTKFGVGLRREPIDPEFEAPLFVPPPIYLAGCLPHHGQSQVTLLTPQGEITPGSRFLFRIDLYNSYGRPRCAGGDEVRAWLKSQDGRSSVAAKVKDLHNGSYVGETVLPWPGVTFVRVSLTYAREFLRLGAELHHTFHSMRFNIETMSFQNYTEKVLCLPSAPVPGYAKACNFTAANGGRPWYCGYPVTPQLSCRHRRRFGNANFTQPLPVPPPLQRYVRLLRLCCPSQGRYNLRLIPNKIRLETHLEGPSPPPPPHPPCSSLSPRHSWMGPSPKGWLYNGQWVSSGCSLPNFTVDTVQRCMRGKTLLLLGDSNQRFLWQTIGSRMNCTSRNQPSWTGPHICRNNDLRASLLYGVHAMPFTPGLYRKAPILNLPLPRALDFAQKLSYNDTQDLVVVVHYYSHLSFYPVQLYRSFVQAARQTVQEYLKTHPRVKFVIRGPHVMYEGHTPQLHHGDKFAAWYQSIWHQEFADLRDRVWYLDTWDLTLPAENVRLHPDDHVLRDIARVLLGYVCQ